MLKTWNHQVSSLKRQPPLLKNLLETAEGTFSHLQTPRVTNVAATMKKGNQRLLCLYSCRKSTAPFSFYTLFPILDSLFNFHCLCITAEATLWSPEYWYLTCSNTAVLYQPVSELLRPVKLMDAGCWWAASTLDVVSKKKGYQSISRTHGMAWPQA